MPSPPGRDMRILLHIGRAKTGTTSIQRTLRENPKVLEASGIYYPSWKGLPIHSTLRQPFRSRSIQNQPKEVDDARKHWDRIAKQVAKRKPELLVISHEHFMGIDRHSEFRDHIDRLFPGATVRTLCYLRDPVSGYRSFAQQSFKTRGRCKHPNSFAVHGKLAQWQDAFGSLVIRPFLRDTLVDGDVVADFVHHGLEDRVTLSNLDVKTANVSESLEGEIVGNRYRKLLGLSANEASSTNPDVVKFRRVRAMMERDQGDALPTSKPRLRPDVHNLVLQTLADDIAAVEESFGIAFDPALLAPIPGVEAASLDRVIDDPTEIFEYSEQKLTDYTLSMIHLLLKDAKPRGITSSG